MKFFHASIPIIFFLALFSSSAIAEKQTLVEKLIAGYESIDTISCEIRKTSKGNEGTVRMLSRVYYKKRYLIHVDNISPTKRTILSDGKKLYYHVKGASKGFSKKIGELNQIWMDALNNIPATPMDHLNKLKDAPESILPPTDEYPVKRGYLTEKIFAVISCDQEMKPVKIEFFRSKEMKTLVAQYDYSAFKKAGNHCYIPTIHKAMLYLPDGKKATETRIINNLKINGDISNILFDPSIHFKGVKFVDEFKKTYQ